MKEMELQAEIIRLKTELEDCRLVLEKAEIELAEWKKLYAELKEATIQGQIKGDKVNAELQSRIEHCPICSEKCRAGGDDAT